MTGLELRMEFIRLCVCVSVSVCLCVMMCGLAEQLQRRVPRSLYHYDNDELETIVNYTLLTMSDDGLIAIS